ncbi:hypothetical protein CN166_31140 [Sinorhizobium medicae]|uniref:hypothetical protein n=1 Tax=Sinorhizobium medicae TaxID=110321 RepID=UPI000FD220EC|nr:hypothetical protein [Sinorhizobium medicae]MQW00022.1 hypothetical protein [Sinorhizobium medicae]RVJ49578.1 hypothetical protein CN166_31140 [Sinorhizobium medicae]
MSVSVIVGILELLKAAVWPAAVLIIFVSLYRPLKGLLRKLPEVVGRADVITIGDIKVQLSKALELDATPRVRLAVTELNSETATRLLHLSGIHVICQLQIHNGVQIFKQQQSADKKLQELNLVTITDRPTENDPPSRTRCYEVVPTELGEQTKSFLIQFLSSSLRFPSDE